MSKKLVVIGVGEQGKVIRDLAEKCGYEIVAFVDDFAKIDTIDTIPVLKGMDQAEKYRENCEFIIAIGNNQIRKRIAQENPDLHFATLVHPTAVIGKDAVIEGGTTVMAQAVIQPFAHVGAHAIINTGTIVEHDNVIGDFSHLSPRVALGGAVKVGEETHIGIGAVVRHGITIGSQVVVGAGAVVVKDIEVPGTYVGVPAKLLNK